MNVAQTTLHSQLQIEVLRDVEELLIQMLTEGEEESNRKVKCSEII